MGRYPGPEARFMVVKRREWAEIILECEGLAVALSTVACRLKVILDLVYKQLRIRAAML